jgi:hypothetical protein
LTNFTLTNSEPSGSSDVGGLMGAQQDAAQTIAELAPSGSSDIDALTITSDAVAPLSGTGIIPLGNGSEVASESPQPIVSEGNAGPSTTVNTGPKLVYNTTHPNVLIPTSGRNWFSFTYSKNVSQKKSTDLLN